MGQWESSEEEEEGEARSRYSDGRSSLRFLRGQKFTVVLISPFNSQSEHVSGCWENFDPLWESDCEDLKPTSASPPSLLFSLLSTSFYFIIIIIPTFSSQTPNPTIFICPR